MRWPQVCRQVAFCLVCAVAVLPVAADEVDLIPLREKLQARLAGPDILSSPEQTEAVAAFYEGRDYVPAWIGRSGLN